MRILLIGNGGREHALCWKLAESSRVSSIFTAPGNPGTASISKNKNVDISSNNLNALCEFAHKEKIDLTIVGPEKPLAEGIVDLFQNHQLMIFGPTQAQAQLESSKKFAKEMMENANVPTASYKVLYSSKEAHTYLAQTSYPIVLKADGLAQGKGVSICKDEKEAESFIHKVMQEKIFGNAGKTVVAEEYLEGEEASFFIFAHGTKYVPLVSAQDHKRLLEGEKGPNTGGMGAYSPAPILNTAMQEKVEKTIVQPMLQTLSEKEIFYSGVLYLGLMITSQGPKVLEFNVRFGDPEAQVILPRMKSDLVEFCEPISRGAFPSGPLEWHEESAMGVVLACHGYPQSPKTGAIIKGLNQVPENVYVFQAGTCQKDNETITSGGRVLTLTALGKTLEKSHKQVYQAVELIDFEGKVFRKDIGWRVLDLKP